MTDKTIFLILITVFSLFHWIQPAAAQSPSPWSRNFNRGVQERCWKAPSVNMTPEQEKELQNIQESFLKEAIPLYDELRTIRLETQYFTSDKPVPATAVKKKMMGIREKLEQLAFLYRNKARSLFTEEQLKNIPVFCALGMSGGFGTGLGRGGNPLRGFRWNKD
jgi:hypothetical protein